jgi:general stress protein 26
MVFSSTRSEKVADIHRNPRANLTFSHSEAKTFVSLCGRAELVADRYADQTWPCHADRPSSDIGSSGDLSMDT